MSFPVLLLFPSSPSCTTHLFTALWRTYPPNTNYGHLTNIHKTAITDLQWSLNSPLLYTISADSTLVATDLTTGTRVRKVRAHKGVVNAVDRSIAAGGGMELVATCGDDGLLKIWESPNNSDFSSVGKRAVATHSIGCPLTSLAFSADGQTIYCGALDNLIHIYDIRKQAVTSTLTGHTNTPTSLSLSPSGSFLLSPSLSSQTIIFDIRPFSPTPNRIHRVLQGAPSGFENSLLRGAWSKEDGGSRVGLGGSDRTVTIWDVESGKVQYKLPGHKGTVMSVDFHPKEPIGELLAFPFTAVLTCFHSFDWSKRRHYAVRRDRTRSACIIRFSPPLGERSGNLKR